MKILIYKTLTRSLRAIIDAIHTIADVVGVVHDNVPFRAEWLADFKARKKSVWEAKEAERKREREA